jgi:hypothetical protein
MNAFESGSTKRLNLSRREFTTMGSLAGIAYLLSTTGCQSREAVNPPANKPKKRAAKVEQIDRLAAFFQLREFAESNYGDAVVEVKEGGPIALLMYGEDHVADRDSVKASIEQAEKDCDLEALGFEGFAGHPDSKEHAAVNRYLAEVLSRGGGKPAEANPEEQEGSEVKEDDRSMKPYFFDDRFKKVIGLERVDLAKVTALAHSSFESILFLGNVAAEQDVQLVKEIPEGMWVNADLVTIINVERAMGGELGHDSFPQIDIQALKKNGYVLNRNNWSVIGQLRTQFDIWANQKVVGPRNQYAGPAMVDEMQQSGLTKGAVVFGRLHFRNKDSNEGPFDSYLAGPSIQKAINEKYGDKVGYIRIDGSKLPDAN